MTSNAFRYLLFPNTTLTEKDYRHFFILLPHLSLLQVLRPPFIPPWGQEQFCGWPVVEEEEQIEQIRMFLKGFQDFANVHGENSMMASLSHEWIAQQALDSRFQIQDTLRGKKQTDPLESKRNLLLEAAVFIEMSRDLDQHEAELADNFIEVEGLEEEFRQILGIGSEEDLDEALEALPPSLVAERSGLSFMLPKRIACWFRLFLHRVPQESLMPLLVALNREIIEEVLDPIAAQRDRSGKPLELTRTSLLTLPSLEHLAPEDFQALIHELLTSGHLADYRQKLEDLLRSPADRSLHDALTTGSTPLQKTMEDFCRGSGKVGQKRVGLTLTALKDCSLSELGKCLDKEGKKVWTDALVAQRSPGLFLNLEWA